MNIVYSKQAVKSINHLSVPTKHRVRRGIHKLPGGDVKRLKGHADLYRLRIGDLRVLFTMTADDILIEDVLPRGRAYR
jgi:mRNA interferase RelE/StbE